MSTKAIALIVIGTMNVSAIAAVMLGVDTNVMMGAVAVSVLTLISVS